MATTIAIKGLFQDKQIFFHTPHRKFDPNDGIKICGPIGSIFSRTLKIDLRTDNRIEKHKVKRKDVIEWLANHGMEVQKGQKNSRQLLFLLELYSYKAKDKFPCYLPAEMGNKTVTLLPWENEIKVANFFQRFFGLTIELEVVVKNILTTVKVSKKSFRNWLDEEEVSFAKDNLPTKVLLEKVLLEAKGKFRGAYPKTNVKPEKKRFTKRRTSKLPVRRSRQPSEGRKRISELRREAEELTELSKKRSRETQINNLDWQAFMRQGEVEPKGKKNSPRTDMFEAHLHNLTNNGGIYLSGVTSLGIPLRNNLENPTMRKSTGQLSPQHSSGSNRVSGKKLSRNVEPPSTDMSKADAGYKQIVVVYRYNHAGCKSFVRDLMKSIERVETQNGYKYSFTEHKFLNEQYTDEESGAEIWPKAMRDQLIVHFEEFASELKKIDKSVNEAEVVAYLFQNVKDKGQTWPNSREEFVQNSQKNLEVLEYFKDFLQKIFDNRFGDVRTFEQILEKRQKVLSDKKEAIKRNIANIKDFINKQSLLHKNVGQENADLTKLLDEIEELRDCIENDKKITPLRHFGEWITFKGQSWEPFINHLKKHIKEAIDMETDIKNDQQDIDGLRETIKAKGNLKNAPSQQET